MLRYDHATHTHKVPKIRWLHLLTSTLQHATMAVDQTRGETIVDNSYNVLNNDYQRRLKERTMANSGSSRLCADCYSDYLVALDPDGISRCADCTTVKD